MISVLVSCLMMFLVIYFMVLSLDFGSMFDFIYCVTVSVLISPHLLHFTMSYFASFPHFVMFPAYYYSPPLKCAAMLQQKMQYFTFILNEKPSDSPIGTSVETSLMPEAEPDLTFLAVVIHVSPLLPMI